MQFVRLLVVVHQLPLQRQHLVLLDCQYLVDPPYAFDRELRLPRFPHSFGREEPSWLTPEGSCPLGRQERGQMSGGLEAGVLELFERSFGLILDRSRRDSVALYRPWNPLSRHLSMLVPVGANRMAELEGTRRPEWIC
jgi:hypothetical protein